MGMLMAAAWQVCHGGHVSFLKAASLRAKSEPSLSLSLSSSSSLLLSLLLLLLWLSTLPGDTQQTEEYPSWTGLPGATV